MPVICPSLWSIIGPTFDKSKPFSFDKSKSFSHSPQIWHWSIHDPTINHHLIQWIREINTCRKSLNLKALKLGVRMACVIFGLTLPSTCKLFPMSWMDSRQAHTGGKSLLKRCPIWTPQLGYIPYRMSAKYH